MDSMFRSHGRWLVLPILSLSLVAGCGKDPTKPNTPPAQPDFYVSATSGLDTNGGTSAQPFKTITHAIAVAGTGQWVSVTPGTYDAANGETFPIVLKPGQSLTGDVANKGNGTTPTIVFGHGATPGGPWNFATFVGAEGVNLQGLRIGSTYQTLHAGVTGKDVAVTVADNTFDGPAYTGVMLEGTGTSHILRNVFNTGSYGVYMLFTPDSSVIEGNHFVTPQLPIEISGAYGAPRLIVRGNRIVGAGQLGIQIQSGLIWIEDNTFDKPGGYATYGAIRCEDPEATPIVRRNSFTCALGIRIDDGLPDLGTAGSPGQNVFTGVSGAAVQHASSAAISAIGNTWQHSPPTAGVDIIVSGTGSVRWGTGAGQIIP